MRNRWTVGAGTLGAAAGGVALIAGLRSGQGGLLLASLASAWLFFAGVAAGGVALSAAVRVAQGRWAPNLLPAADALGSFFLPAWILLAVLVFGAGHWIPWAIEAHLHPWSPLALRELLVTAVLFGVGTLYLRQARTGPSAERIGVLYLLLYVGTLSMWDVDFVMNLHEWAPSTVLPAMYFMGSFLCGLAWSALVTCARNPKRFGGEERHDVGKLLFALVTFWAYLLWSAYLPTWYGNIPEEVGQLMARWTGGYHPVTITVLALGICLPFVLFIPEWTKRMRSTLALGALSILIASLAERFLLVFPSLDFSPTRTGLVLGAAVTAGVGGLFLLGFRPLPDKPV